MTIRDYCKWHKYTISPAEIASEELLPICKHLEQKGHLNPYSLEFKKMIFPERENEETYVDICNTEKEIEKVNNTTFC